MKMKKVLTTAISLLFTALLFSQNCNCVETGFQKGKSIFYSNCPIIASDNDNSIEISLVSKNDEGIFITFLINNPNLFIEKGSKIRLFAKNNMAYTITTDEYYKNGMVSDIYYSASGDVLTSLKSTEVYAVQIITTQGEQVGGLLSQSGVSQLSNIIKCMTSGK